MGDEQQVPGQLGLFDVPAAAASAPAQGPPGSIQATVYGLPKPQGSMNSARTRAGKQVVFHHNAKELLPWREAVTWALRAAHRGDPLTGPVAVNIVFTLRKPNSAPKRRHVYPTKQPDLDKLLRGVLDAATYAGVWRDDAQVVRGYQAKHYTGDGFPDVLPTPGAVIRIWPVPAVAR
jgi:crossover junction endodeoxyribonuclease RusA